MCDVSSDGGGWLTVLVRKDGSVDFAAPSFSDYAYNGVGNFVGEFFTPLEHLYLLTANHSMELIVEMRDGSDTAWAYYSSFSVGDNSTNYALSVSGYDPASSAGDALSYHNGMAFSAWDVDNDGDGLRNCAADNQAGWWYKFCYKANPLGIYGDDVTSAGNTWKPWKGNLTPLEEISFKLRIPKCNEGFGSTCSACDPSYYVCQDPVSGRRTCCESPITSCEQATHSGRYDLLLSGLKHAVKCEQSIEGGGWTSVLLRDSGALDFRSPGWSDYANVGVGHPDT